MCLIRFYSLQYNNKNIFAVFSSNTKKALKFLLCSKIKKNSKIDTKFKYNLIMNINKYNNDLSEPLLNNTGNNSTENNTIESKEEESNFNLLFLIKLFFFVFRLSLLSFFNYFGFGLFLILIIQLKSDLSLTDIIVFNFLTFLYFL